MITSRSIHRMVFSAVLLVLPLLSYCSEMAGTPYPEVDPAGQVETLKSSALSAHQGAQEKDPARSRRILADMENRTRSGL